MSVINHSLVVLLDIQNEHKNLEAILDFHVFSRFNIKIKCLEYVSSRLTNTRLLHFFIPQSDHTIINQNLLFSNTIYYIYCRDQASINEMKQQYAYPMFIKIFHINSLLTYLRQAAISHLIEQAERRQHEPDEHEIALQTAAEYSHTLKNDLYKYMIEKLSSN